MKNNIQHLLRTMNLLSFANGLYFFVDYVKNFYSNKKTIRQNPSVKFPPESLLFEVFAKTNYEKYLETGREAAQSHFELIKKHKQEADIQIILDWGCGVARITRHLPDALPNRTIFGIDINDDMIAWCKENINGVTFQKNNLMTPTSFPNDFF